MAQVFLPLFTARVGGHVLETSSYDAAVEEYQRSLTGA